VNKADLIEKVAGEMDIAKTEATKAVDVVLDSITNSLKNGNDVAITGFGTFKVKRREERKGRNPKTGEEITIKAANAASFKAGKGLKEAINQS
jgi:DNA-binding protein HU-beta